MFHSKPLPEREVFWGYVGRKAMRQGNWKLILPKKDAEPLLFNLKEDVGENNNLAQEYPEVVKDMLAKIALWNNDVNKLKHN